MEIVFEYSMRKAAGKDVAGMIGIKIDFDRNQEQLPCIQS